MNSDGTKELVGFEIMVSYSFTYLKGELAIFNGLDGAGVGYYGAGRFNKLVIESRGFSLDDFNASRSYPQGGGLNSVDGEIFMWVVGGKVTEAVIKGAWKVIGKAIEKKIVNQTAKAILKNGFYEVNGFKFSKYYYEKLWATGRKALSLIAP